MTQLRRPRAGKLLENPLTDAIAYCTRRLTETCIELSKPREPLGKERIGPQAQLQKYEQMRSDPLASARLLTDKGPVQVAAYVREMEQLRAGRAIHESPLQEQEVAG
jgi:hypothetical protein